MSLRDNLPPEADRPSEKEGRETGSFTVVPLTEDMEFVEPNPTRLHIQMLPDGRFRAPSPDTRKIVREIPVGASPHGVWTLDHAPRR